MKTTSKSNLSSELISRSHHHQPEQGQPEAPATPQTNLPSHSSHESHTPERKDHRLPIDSEVRKQNRTLPTPKVLTALHQQLPAAYRLAEVVGRWVWVTFKEQPTAEIRQQLAQLGFHWNRDRQAWQHPCGKFTLRSPHDPHEKYSSYYPARTRRSTTPATTPQEATA